MATCPRVRTDRMRRSPASSGAAPGAPRCSDQTDAALLRQWGRIGTEGRRRLDPHHDPGAALNAPACLAGRKRGRGCQDCGT
ncbi:MAG: WGR domain-containing protein [Acetobacteraceae bacterium]|nr:WGR domain-containing protein [Acetobacteraceae bacterium]